MSDAVLCSKQDGVAVVTLNRPERMNAINYPLLLGLVETLRDVAHDAAIRCVVLTGAGRGFCSGGDLKEGAQPPPEERARMQASQTRGAVIRAGSEASLLLHDMAKPTIAMINGPVAGAGIGLAGSCDLRFAATSASFSTAYERIGGSGDYGATWLWPRLLGGARARELFMMPQSFSAAEAHAFGLYTRVFNDDALQGETMACAQRIAGGTGASWAYLKANLNAAEVMPFAAHLDVESLHMSLAVAAASKSK